MGINTIPISARTAPFDPSVTANGSFTLPRYAFIPHPALQQLSGPYVAAPTMGQVIPASFAAPYELQRPYPQASLPNAYGIRRVNRKVSP